MTVFHDQAVVLRTHKLGEADRIITLLTQEHGLRRAVARGVRKTSSRFGGRLEPFSVVQVQLYQGRSLDNITQVVSQRLYGVQLSQNYDAYQAASAVCETAVQLTENEQHVAPQHFFLVAGALGALARAVAAPQLLLASYLLRALAVAGWAVQLESCLHCEAAQPTDPVFSFEYGGVLCGACAGVDQPAAAALAVPGLQAVTAAQLEVLRALLCGDWERVNQAAQAVQRGAAQTVQQFAQWYLERRLRSLRLQ